MTVEDPVEYVIEGVTQIHVNRKRGLTFPVAVRHILRQDPDVILVGEIRDLESAELCFQAAITGHLVLSTLHTETAEHVLIRLVDMGLEPFIIGSGLIAATAQRLVRKVCADCGQDVEPTEQERAVLAQWAPDVTIERVRRGTRCENCRSTGYRGRAGIFEIMPMTPELAQLVQERPSRRVLAEHCRPTMRTMHRDAALKVRDGITTVEEATRVLAGISVGA
jgi:type IV pilus assembly protein PilB